MSDYFTQEINSDKKIASFSSVSLGGWDCNLESYVCAQPLNSKMGEKKKECPEGYNLKEAKFGSICVKP